MPDRKQEALDILARYWGEQMGVVAQLPVVQADALPEDLPPKLSFVELPEWAADCGVDGKILIPTVWMGKWDQIPWYDVVWWMAHGWAERLWEKRYGCVHSYSKRLLGWDGRLWDYAWVNRIALFLRRWAAEKKSVSEESLFGALPKAELLLTHDVDAISKTGMIRFKQAAFSFFNSLRLLLKGDTRMAAKKSFAAMRFLLASDDYMGIPRLMEAEENYGKRSTFFFYAGKTGLLRSIASILIDPSYDIACNRLRPIFTTLLSGGWEVGLHPSAFTWNEPEGIARQRENLEAIIEKPVTVLRQHWLRFSWEKTWRAQEEAGLRVDSTLGFNDRPGFRNAAALRMPVYSKEDRKSLLESVPMFLMDSHLYDYLNLSSPDRLTCIKHWLGELNRVGGVGSVIWHTQVCGRDYGWMEGYEKLLECWETINGQN